MCNADDCILTTLCVHGSTALYNPFCYKSRANDPHPFIRLATHELPASCKAGLSPSKTINFKRWKHERAKAKV